MNSCQTIITTGPNKGKLCSQVTDHCRHLMKVCACGKKFNHLATYDRHRKNCELYRNRAKIIVKKHPATEISKNIVTVGNNNNNSNSNNINIITIAAMCADDYYERLVNEKFGGDEVRAVNFIASVARKGNFYDVFGRLFVEGRSIEDMPCVSFDQKDLVYMMNDKLVRDIGGVKLGGKIYNSATNAVLKSANFIINRCLSSDTIELLFTEHDIGKIQQNLCNSTAIKAAITKALLKNMYSLSHPRFSMYNPAVIPPLLEQLPY